MGASLNDINNLLCKIYLLKKGYFGFSVKIIQITITPSLKIVDVKTNLFFDSFPQKKGEKLNLQLFKVWVKKHKYKVSFSTSLKHLKRELNLELMDLMNSNIDYKKSNFIKLINSIKTKIVNFFKP